MSDKSAAWNTKNLGIPDEFSKFVRHHPSELMLRSLFSSTYSTNPPKITSDTRVLDIGAMYMNNLVPFHDRGARCFGVEINEDMVSIARRCAEQQSIAADIRVGSNRSLGHENDSFDIVLSINVVHYENDQAGLRAAIEEYHRVLDKDGRLFVVSAGSEHYIRLNAKHLGPNRFEITADDFRRGQVMAYFEDEAQLGELLSEKFRLVETGRVIEKHARANVDFLYAVAVK
ncbi:class I SAM-dependent methyltransferase [Bradyrhizobium sp. G127]|uniref:class I SAM-dependent methyltransferase n=1 Tax=Bradyrhizobium sp. G127 TaxID=2904800 RepID=UPI001F2DD937|nr:class I SAM-dependent methyltransferase [Bradyrhizobium sp. G127]MCF2524453.1 class I SAM-dependent methyltransferase [Bradyrhizobium sp. G127]